MWLIYASETANSVSLDGCLGVHRKAVFVGLGLSTGHANEDGCVPITQWDAALVECQSRPATLVAVVSVDVS